ncbi:MAG: FecR family protein, partial [Bdellovibrionia bacterium]
MKLIKESILFLSVLSGLFWASADAKFGEHLAVVTKLEGKVKIFTHPSNTLPRTLQSNGKGTHVLYDGEYYLAEDAKIGDHVENGNILQTLPGAKAKLVYPNGDQFYVGPATSYRVFFMDKSGHGDTRINLMYGKMRGIVEKGGPRTILYIRTKTAIMGVRGTDFFIAQGGLEESTEVSILRGSVEVTPNNIPEARGKFFKISDSSPSMGDLKSTQVKAGFSADIGTPSVLALSNLPAVDLRKT